MSTFSQDKINARGDHAAVDKDNPSAEEIKQADENTTGQESIPPTDPNKPTELLDESQEEAGDRHVASTELPVGDVTPPETQADTAPADDAAELIVPGAGVGPDPAGVVLNEHGRVAYAPPGSHNAAMNGVQEDASGFVDSVGTDNSSASGTRI
jgi:hypothetical protein